jgi:hypothetical protein
MKIILPLIQFLFGLALAIAAVQIWLWSVLFEQHEDMFNYWLYYFFFALAELAAFYQIRQSWKIISNPNF